VQKEIFFVGYYVGLSDRSGAENEWDLLVTFRSRKVTFLAFEVQPKNNIIIKPK